MKLANKTVLVLALAAGLVLPVTNVNAASVEERKAELEAAIAENNANMMNLLESTDQKNQENENLEEIPTLPADSELIYTTAMPTPDEEEDPEEETEDPDELAQAIIDQLNRNTEQICGDCLLEAEEGEKGEGESYLSSQLISQAYIFNGQSLALQTLQIVDSNDAPLANVVSIREFAYTLAHTAFKFDVKTNGTNFYIQKGSNYQGGTTKKFDENTLANASIEEFTGKIIVDGKETAISGYIVDGEPMVRASILSNALDFRFRNDVTDSSKLLVNTDKSDIKVPTVAELDEEIKKKDYTVLFNWGPWCPWSKHEIPMVEKFAQYLMEQDKYDIQVLGLINKSENYTNQELGVLFHENRSLWKNYGTDDEIRSHIDDLLGYRLQGFPTSFIVNRNLEKMGEEFYEYYDNFLALYMAENGLTEEDYEDLYISDFDNMKVDDYNKEIVYSNFLRYAIEGAEVDLTDKNLLKPVTVKNEDKSGWSKEASKADPKAAVKKVAVKETKAPKSSNPKTGVTSVTGAVAMAAIATVALKKTKRD